MPHARGRVGKQPHSGPNRSVYLRIYKFVNFFEKSACTVLKTWVIIFLVERAGPTKRIANQHHSMSEWRNWQTR